MPSANSTDKENLARHQGDQAMRLSGTAVRPAFLLRRAAIAPFNLQQGRGLRWRGNDAVEISHP